MGSPVSAGHKKRNNQIGAVFFTSTVIVVSLVNEGIEVGKLTLHRITSSTVELTYQSVSSAISLGHIWLEKLRSIFKDEHTLSEYAEAVNNLIRTEMSNKIKHLEVFEVCKEHINRLKTWTKALPVNCTT